MRTTSRSKLRAETKTLSVASERTASLRQESLNRSSLQSRGESSPAVSRWSALEGKLSAGLEQRLQPAQDLAPSAASPG